MFFISSTLQINETPIQTLNWNKTRLLNKHCLNCPDVAQLLFGDQGYFLSSPSSPLKQRYVKCSLTYPAVQGWTGDGVCAFLSTYLIAINDISSHRRSVVTYWEQMNHKQEINLSIGTYMTGKVRHAILVVIHYPRISECLQRETTDDWHLLSEMSSRLSLSRVRHPLWLSKHVINTQNVMINNVLKCSSSLLPL